MLEQSEISLISNSPIDTESIAKIIGGNLHGGEVIELASDLGGGKTLFTSGLVSGAGSIDQVSSPTFMISKVYKCPKFVIHHFDFYRLSEPGIVALELQEVMNEPKTVIVLEWAGIVKNVLPEKLLRIEIEHAGEEKRKLKFYIPKELEYLIQGIKN